MDEINLSCNICSLNCFTCFGYDNNCSSCKISYYLQGNECLNCDETCLACTDEGNQKCINCSNGYYFDNNLC